MYMVCDMAKQGRADELMAEFATVYNSHVGPGKLTGWSWLEHQVGGDEAIYGQAVLAGEVTVTATQGESADAAQASSPLPPLYPEHRLS